MNKIIALEPVINVPSMDVISWINSFEKERRYTYNILYNNYFFDRNEKFLLNTIDQKYIKLLIAKSNCNDCDFTIDELYNKFVETDTNWLIGMSNFFDTMIKINSKFTFSLNTIGKLVEEPPTFIPRIITSIKHGTGTIDKFIDQLQIINLDQ